VVIIQEVPMSAGPNIIKCLDEPDLFKPHFKGESWGSWWVIR
jgi:hypothetical protein